MRYRSWNNADETTGKFEGKTKLKNEKQQIPENLFMVDWKLLLVLFIWWSTIEMISYTYLCQHIYNIYVYIWIICMWVCVCFLIHNPVNKQQTLMLLLLIKFSFCFYAFETRKNNFHIVLYRIGSFLEHYSLFFSDCI